MSLNVSFTISERDLKYFHTTLVRAQQRVSEADDASIIAGARDALSQIDERTVPGFVSEQLKNLRTMIEMVDDEDWPLEDQERLDVVSAIAYFYKSEDMISDEIPTMGLIDDAIMIQLVARELQNEIEAYHEFCEFRASAEQRSGEKVSPEDWLKARQHELFERMRDRMNRHHRTSRGVGRLTQFSLS